MRCLILTMPLVALLAAPTAHAGDRFLSGGGSIDTGQNIGFDADDDAYLAGGGGIEEREDRERRRDNRFLDDGGGISSDVEYRSSDREEFLEDGGSITTRPLLRPVPGYVRVERPERRRWRIATAERARFERSGSFISVGGGGRRIASTTNEIPFETGVRFNEGPLTLDVESERLDRRAYPASGVETLTTRGGSKIIRIAPDF